MIGMWLHILKDNQSKTLVARATIVPQTVVQLRLQVAVVVGIEVGIGVGVGVEVEVGSWPTRHLHSN